MAVPTVNVTCTVTNQTGAVVPGATVTAQLTGIDLYGTNYIFPSVQSFVTDGTGLVTMPLFPNALGARRTAYQFTATDPVTGRALINITAVVPNQNIDLSVLDAINKLPAYAPPLTQPFSATLTSLASLGVAVGAILFGGAGQAVIQDSANLFWDNTAKRLGIGNAAPGVALDVTGIIRASASLTAPVVNTTGGTAGSVSNAPVSMVNNRIISWLGLSGTFTDCGFIWYDGTNNLTIGTNNASRLTLNSSGTAIYPSTDNTTNLGISGTNRFANGYFSASVVTPLVNAVVGGDLNLQSGDSTHDIFFSISGVANAWRMSHTGLDFLPETSLTPSIGSPTKLVKQLFTPIIDSGTTGSLSLKTNNGTTQLTIANDGTISVVSGGKLISEYLDTGTVNPLNLRANSVVQFQVLYTASANRNITVTGSNGGNPVLNTSAGGIDISPATVRFPGIGTTAVAANATLNAVGSNDLLRSTSSKRYKTEIEALSRDEAVALLRKLSPVTYASMCEQDDPYLRHSGFIAEEVFKVNPLFVSFSRDDKGNKRPESVQYERLTVPLVAGWQDHETRLAALEARPH